MMDERDVMQVWLPVAALAALFVAAALWMRHAPALEDLAIWPALALLGVVFWQGADYGSLLSAFNAEPPLETPPSEMGPPYTVSIFIGLGLAISAMAFWRAQQPSRFPLIWIGGAASFAPLMAATLEIFWEPAGRLGGNLWATHPVAIAALMALFAERSHRRGGEHVELHTALFTMAALTMISLALILVLSNAALTVSLAVMILLAALIDRGYGLKPLMVFVEAGIAVIAWRLVVDPGIYWAIGGGIYAYRAAPALLWEVQLAYGGTIALLIATWFMLGHRERSYAQVIVESAVVSFTTLLAGILLYRALGDNRESHWGFALMGLIWLTSMFAQLYRSRAGGPLKKVRLALATLFGLIGGGSIALSLTAYNPVTEYSEFVLGPPIADTLFVAYGLPAILFALAAWKLDLPAWMRKTLTWLSPAFAAIWIGMEIRRLWQGPILSRPGMSDGELYTYTVVMLIAAVALLFFAFARRSVGLRKLAIIGIGLTIAKVFLIDMAGLAGLVRVASFLGLGLSLAALAWVNRRMDIEWDRGNSSDPSKEETG